MHYLKYKYNQFRASYLLKAVDKQTVPDGFDEIRLFAIARNESLRLPYFLSYYFNRGVDRVFIIDNNSTDNSKEIYRSYKNVHIFSTLASYQEHWHWMEYMLNRFGVNHWCLVVDIDELLFYPFAEQLSIRDMIDYLENHRFTALRSLLLDMYSDKPIIETTYQSGGNPLESCPYFDTDYEISTSTFFDRKNWKPFKAIDFRGGMRERVFGKKLPYRLPKVSLFKYQKRTYLTQGMHAINNARIADIQGVVFHTKFLYDFIEEAVEEAKREEHFGNAVMYKIFDQKIKMAKNLTLHCKDAVKFQDSLQLIRLGLMKSSETFSDFVKRQAEAVSIIGT